MLDVGGEYYGHFKLSDDIEEEPLNLEKDRSEELATRKEPDSVDITSDSLAFIRAQLNGNALLTKEQEIDFAQQLARASCQLAFVCITDDSAVKVINELFLVALNGGLKKKMFSNQQRYFALRREIEDLVSMAASREAVAVLQKEISEALKADKGSHSSSSLSFEAFESVLAIDWPGPLMLALTQRVERNAEKQPTDKLSAAIEEFAELHSLIDKTDRKRPASDQYRDAVIDKASARYFKARDALVNHNLRLVFHVAKRYAENQDYMSDLIQEGMFGLIRAAEKYRPATGNRFSTYAHQWIDSKIRQARVNVDKLVPISLKYNNDLLRVSKCLEKSKIEGTRLSYEELRQASKLSQDKFNAVLQLKQVRLSLDDSATGDESFTLHARLADPNADTFRDALRLCDADYIDALLSRVLNQREIHVINERFGRTGKDGQTFKELSASMGLSSERVRQLEIAALDKLNQYLSPEATN